MSEHPKRLFSDGMPAGTEVEMCNTDPWVVVSLRSMLTTTLSHTIHLCTKLDNCCVSPTMFSPTTHHAFGLCCNDQSSCRQLMPLKLDWFVKGQNRMYVSKVTNCNGALLIWPSVKQLTVGYDVILECFIAFIMQDRTCALAALASHLWQGRADASSPQPATRDEAVASSPKFQGRTTVNSPLASIRPLAEARSPREQLEGIAATAAGIRADIDAGTVAAGKKGRPDLPNQMDQTSNQHSTTVSAVGQQGDKPTPGLTEREARIAARAGKVSRRAATSSLAGSLGPSSGPRGKPSGQDRGTDGQSDPVIPQSDGPADDEDTNAVVARDSVNADGNVMASPGGQDTQMDDATANPTATTAGCTASLSTSGPATAHQDSVYNGPTAVGAQSTAVASASDSSVAQAQVHSRMQSGPGQPPVAVRSTTLGFLSSTASMPSQALPSLASGAIPKGPSSPSALEQMAARYLHPSSSARTHFENPHSASTHRAGPSSQAASGKASVQQSDQASPSHQPAGSPLKPVFDSTPEERLGLTLQHAGGQQHAAGGLLSTQTVDALRAQQATAVKGSAEAQSTTLLPKTQGQAPAALLSEVSSKAQVVCPCTGRKYHFGCMPQQDQLQVRVSAAGS